MRCTWLCWCAQLSVRTILVAWRWHWTIPRVRIMVQGLQVHIHFILVKSLAIIKVMHMVTVSVYLLSDRVIVVVAASISQIFSPALRNALISVDGLLICQTIHWAVTCHILFPDLNACTGWGVPEVVVADVVTLTEALVYPWLVATSHILVTILIVSWVIVHIIKASLIGSCRSCYST